MEIHPIHGVKRMVASHTTRKRVQKDIGEEYLDSKAQLSNIQKQLRDYQMAADASHAAWNALHKTQREFAANMTESYPRQDDVRATSAQFASNLTALQAASALSDGGEQAPWRILHATVIKYMQEIADVQKCYAPLEASYSEYLRYVAKSDKLSSKKKRNEDKISRNLDKREKNRVDFHSKLDQTVSNMRAVLRKHPAVFQCAIASFWLRNQNQLTLFADHTGQMHSECGAIADALLKIDLTLPETYEALLPANADPLPALPPPSVPHEITPIVAAPGPSAAYGAPVPQAPINYAPTHVAPPVSFSSQAPTAANASPTVNGLSDKPSPAKVNFPSASDVSRPQPSALKATVSFPTVNEASPIKEAPAKEAIPQTRPHVLDTGPKDSSHSEVKSRPHVFKAFTLKPTSSAAPAPSAPAPPPPTVPQPPLVLKPTASRASVPIPPPPPSVRPAPPPISSSAPPPPPPPPPAIRPTPPPLSSAPPPPPPPPPVRPPPIST